MNLVKMTRNGQVTIPVDMRKHINANYYVCDMKNGAIVFKPLEVNEGESKRKKYTMDDFRAFGFEGRDKNEKNLADKVDEITYGL